jgi:hypothetical protein
MNKCPHCDADPCLPLWRKLALGPTSHARCQVCGFRVGVDVDKALLAMAPSFLLIILVVLRVVTDPVFLVVAGMTCLCVSGVLYAEWVPLMPDELSNARMVEAGRARIAAEKKAASERRGGHAP